MFLIFSVSNMTSPSIESSHPPNFLNTRMVWSQLSGHSLHPPWFRLGVMRIPDFFRPSLGCHQHLGAEDHPIADITDNPRLKMPMPMKDFRVVTSDHHRIQVIGDKSRHPRHPILGISLRFMNSRTPESLVQHIRKK